MNKNVLFFAFLLLLMFIPVSFASDDGGVLTSDVNASATADVLSVQSDEILSGDGDVVYFDANEDIFYIKETDINNYPTIRSYKFEEIKPKENLKTVEYVTIEEFNKFKEELLNGKQYIRDDSSTNSVPRRYAASATNTEHDSAGS